MYPVKQQLSIQNQEKIVWSRKKFILVDWKLENKTVTLANIYAPNDDNPNFFKNFFRHLLSFECDDIILGGDFNLVMDVQND